MDVNNQPLVEFKNVYFTYGANEVLEDINFQIFPGEYIGLVGPNGAGKTTLLKLLLGVLKPTSGFVRFHSNASIGYVPQRLQSPEFFFPATVEEVIMSGFLYRSSFSFRISAEQRAVLQRAIDLTNLERLRHRPIFELSGGERQRVFIARALIGDPKILVFDEPSTGVDVHHQESFYSFVEKLHRDFGITIILVSHDLDVVAKNASRCLCLNHTIICSGKPNEVFSNQENFEKLYGKKLTYHQHGHDF